MATKLKAGDQYLLQDGTYAAPGDCSAGKDGVLRHKNGLAVSLDDNGDPMTREGTAVTGKNVEAAIVGQPKETPVEDTSAGLAKTPAGEAPAKPVANPVKPA